MVPEYYNLAEQPFGVTPDTRYLYLSPTHREALASLRYGLQSGRGFMSIIAKPGMGKTTLLFQLLQQLDQSIKSVFLFQTLCTPVDLLRSLLQDLGIDAHDRSLTEMHSQLNECLLSESRGGRQIVIVIDEAQNLSESALELLRMLSNFETPRKKMMQIILAGQPHLAEKLASPALVQLRQRISIVARLRPFSYKETNEYVGDRLRVAGYDFRTSFFTPGAGALIAEQSDGIPRNINNICFNALSLGCALKRKPIDEEIIREVLDDLDLHSESSVSESEIALKILPPIKSTLPSSTDTKIGTRAHGRIWASRLAMAAALLLTLFWPVGLGHGDTKVLPSQTSQAATTNADPSSSQILSTSPSLTDSELPAPKSLDSGAGPNANRLGSVSPDRRETIFRNSEIDLVELWKQVGNGNTNAEIALAGLYADGVLIPQNCLQAQILLLAASKSGSKDAENVLATHEKNCR